MCGGRGGGGWVAGWGSRQLWVLKVWRAIKKDPPPPLCSHWANTHDQRDEWKESRPPCPWGTLGSIWQPDWVTSLTICFHTALRNNGGFSRFPSPTLSMNFNEAPELGAAGPLVISHTEGAKPAPWTGGRRGEVKISAAWRDDYRAAPRLSCFTAGTRACVGIIVLEYLMPDWLGCFVFDHILKCDLTVGVGN